ncbi:MAG TPA: ComF family protein [Burkholderiaceae bacterium]
MRKVLASARPALLERIVMRCPGQCAVCRSWSTQRVCADCLQRFARPLPRCWTCALQLPPERLGHPAPRCGACLATPPPLDRTIAALDYAFPWDGLLQRYKFHQALDLRDTLLDRLDGALSAAVAEMPDWLIAVPLSVERLRERGYNQSHELARALARRRGLRYGMGMLLRLHGGRPQSGLKASERIANVRHSFAVEPARLADLQDSHVAVLDDVMTTGATMHEVARVLRQAGVAKVQAWVIARTPE